MTWNYRVRRIEYVDAGPGFQIVECYYDANGNIEATTAESIAPFGNTIAELRADLEMMLQALDRPELPDGR